VFYVLEVLKVMRRVPLSMLEVVLCVLNAVETVFHVLE
jgi:hypothetical protein